MTSISADKAFENIYHIWLKTLSQLRIEENLLNSIKGSYEKYLWLPIKLIIKCWTLLTKSGYMSKMFDQTIYI